MGNIMETPILSGSHLNVTLGNHKILNDVSVSFQAGVMHAILGPNYPDSVAYMAASVHPEIFGKPIEP